MSNQLDIGQMEENNHRNLKSSNTCMVSVEYFRITIISMIMFLKSNFFLTRICPPPHAQKCSLFHLLHSINKKGYECK
jgi:hypothetical protein